MIRPLALLVLAGLVAGCQSMPNGGTMAPPELTPVGSGLAVQRAPMPAAYAPADRRTFQSLWGSSNQGLFRDLRAHKVGDTVTVNISIDDKAQFDNQTDRSRLSKRKAGAAASLGINGFGAGTSVDANGNLDLNASSQSKGAGSIGRSEKLKLSVAAVVTEVLPDGNLMISGSQEIKVNEEVRVLNIAGIVRPLDISNDNTIAYDKIAEARISYGGRGRISDVQRPAWGQRLYDAVSPF